MFKKEFITGEELLRRWQIQDYELLRIISDGTITTWHRALLKPYQLEKSLTYHQSGSSVLSRTYLTYDEFLPILPQSLFRIADVENIEATKKEDSIPGQPESKEGISIDVDQLIEQRRREGGHDKEIARELYEKHLLSPYKIAMKFKLANDLNSAQYDTIRKRGIRFIEEKVKKKKK